MLPPPLFAQTIVSSAPAREAASRPPMSCSTASSPVSSHPRPPAASAAPAADDTTPSIPLAPRFARKRIGFETEGKKLSTSRIGIDELTHTVAASGSEVASAAQTFGSSGSSASASAGGTSSSAARQASSHPRVLRDLDGLRELGAGERRVGGGDPLRRARRLVPGQMRIEHELLGAREPCAQRLRRRRVADADGEPGEMSVGPSLVAQQHVVVRDDLAAVMSAAAQSRGGLGEDRPAGRGGERGDRLDGGERGAGTAHEHGIRMRDVGGQPGGRRRGRLPHLDPGLAVGPAGPVVGVQLLGRRRERLAQREVQMDGAGPAACGRRPGPACECAVVHGGTPPRLVIADLHEPLGRRSVHLDLVDRLAGAGVPQLRRPVRGQDDQRHARLVRLHHGGHQVGRGGPGRARHGNRAPARLGQPHGEKSRGALVQHRHRC